MQNLRYALHSLSKSPGFSIIAIIIVALGIGVATAMFSTVNALILRPISFPEPDRLIHARETILARNTSYSVSIPNYLDWADRAKSFESLAASRIRSMNLTSDGGPELAQVTEATSNYLSTLGISVVRGRNFLVEEDKPGGHKVAIISDSFWRSRFDGATDAIGRTLNLDGEAYEIIGVTEAHNSNRYRFGVVIPLAVNHNSGIRLDHRLDVVGRMKSDVTIEQADAELKTVAAGIWAEHPELERGWSTAIEPLAKTIVGDSVRQRLYILLGAVGLLLLLSCANLSNLILVRTSARSHELAIRNALGASKVQIVRQIVTESTLISLVGGLLGILISFWTMDFLRSLPLPRSGEITIDLPVLSIAIIATLLTGFFSGLGPALNAAKIQPQSALKERAGSSGQRSRLSISLIVAQLAISLTLLHGTTLLGESFLKLIQVDPGFNSENTLTLSLRPENDERGAQFYEDITTRISALPGVTQVGTINRLPLRGTYTSNNVFPDGESVLPEGRSIESSWRLIDGGYFEAMQIPLLRGQTFEGMNPNQARVSTIISASLARQLWGDENPIGRQIRSGSSQRLRTVIGVVGDVPSQGLGADARPTFYMSMHLFRFGPMTLVIRSAMEPDLLLPEIRATVKEIDPTIPLFRVRTLDDLRESSLQQDRLILQLLSGFTIMAMLLAMFGTYGVIASMVQRRAKEFGIRIAVGAGTGGVLRLVFQQALWLLALGCLFGLAGSFATGRLLETMLYETGSSDLSSYFIAICFLGLTALVAAYIPARRAAIVDPMEALRGD